MGNKINVEELDDLIAEYASAEKREVKKKEETPQKVRLPVIGKLITPRGAKIYYDEHYKIDGFGNYYYTYDCMMKKVNGDYSFIAYNINEAQRIGLKKGSCY